MEKLKIKKPTKIELKRRYELLLKLFGEKQAEKCRVAYEKGLTNTIRLQGIII